VNSRIRDFIRDVKPGGFSNYIYPIITDNWVYIYKIIKIKFDRCRRVYVDEIKFSVHHIL
jgi:hypothetical protein